MNQTSLNFGRQTFRENRLLTLYLAREIEILGHKCLKSFSLISSGDQDYHRFVTLISRFNIFVLIDNFENLTFSKPICEGNAL